MRRKLDECEPRPPRPARRPRRRAPLRPRAERPADGERRRAAHPGPVRSGPRPRERGPEGLPAPRRSLRRPVPAEGQQRQDPDQVLDRSLRGLRPRRPDGPEAELERAAGHRGAGLPAGHGPQAAHVLPDGHPAGGNGDTVELAHRVSRPEPPRASRPRRPRLDADDAERLRGRDHLPAARDPAEGPRAARRVPGSDGPRRAPPGGRLEPLAGGDGRPGGSPPGRRAGARLRLLPRRAADRVHRPRATRAGRLRAQPPRAPEKQRVGDPQTLLLSPGRAGEKVRPPRRPGGDGTEVRDDPHPLLATGRRSPPGPRCGADLDPGRLGVSAAGRRPG